MKYSVWLSGGDASLWAHRGFTTRGDRVFVKTWRDAKRIARLSCGGRVYGVQTSDGLYCYRTPTELRADQTGAKAVAVVERSGEVES